METIRNFESKTAAVAQLGVAGFVRAVLRWREHFDQGIDSCPDEESQSKTLEPEEGKREWLLLNT